MSEVPMLPIFLMNEVPMAFQKEALRELDLGEEIVEGVPLRLSLSVKFRRPKVDFSALWYTSV